ncbi:phosphopantetheine-binding protein, partial [Shewanella surugensis]
DEVDVFEQDKLDVDDIRSQLSERLPDYMLPLTFTVIDSVPLTLNGKLDKKALPEPSFVDSDNYISPRTELEHQLCQVWQDVLNLESIGVHDNFFRIGGDSIVSIQLVSRLRKMGFNLQVKAIFDSPTINQLALRLAQGPSEVSIKAEQGSLFGEFDLLPIQQWFFTQRMAHPNHFNQSFMLSIPSDVDTNTIEQALYGLSQQHDILRLDFELTEEGYRQAYTANSTMVPLVTLDVSNFDNEALHVQLT